MRFVVWLILLALAAVLAAGVLGSNEGVVTVYRGAWRLDLSLNLFLFLLVLTCFIVVTVMRTVQSLVSLPERARVWRVGRRDRAAQAALREALAQYFAGRYGRASRSAQRALSIQSATPELDKDLEFTVLANLLGAGSAHRLQDRRLRDELLGQAFDRAKSLLGSKESVEGARLMAAEWALDERDADRAFEHLSQLPPGVARRTQALRLRLQAARMAHQPQEALKTARLIAKHGGIAPLAATGFLRSLAFELIDAMRDTDQLRRVWSQFDAADRRDPIVAAHAATAMAALGAPEEARQWIRPFWERMRELASDERQALCAALVAAMEGIGTDWLARLEDFAHQYPRDGWVAYSVGCALAERQLWGKSRLLLEQAAQDPMLEPAPRRAALRRLADIAREQDNHERAAACFEAAARLPG
jgi:HemY protein